MVQGPGESGGGKVRLGGESGACSDRGSCRKDDVARKPAAFACGRQSCWAAEGNFREIGPDGGWMALEVDPHTCPGKPCGESPGKY